MHEKIKTNSINKKILLNFILLLASRRLEEEEKQQYEEVAASSGEGMKKNQEVEESGRKKNHEEKEEAHLGRVADSDERRSRRKGSNRLLALATSKSSSFLSLPASSDLFSIKTQYNMHLFLKSTPRALTLLR